MSRNAHSMPFGDDRCGKLKFGQNGIMLVFYMGLPHMYFISTYIGFMSSETSVKQSISLHVINMVINRGDEDKVLDSHVNSIIFTLSL